MKLESRGILISLRPFGERDVVAHVFTDEYGIVCGLIRGAMVGHRNKPLVGQVGIMVWNARLDSQLGVIHWDSDKNLAVPLMTDSQKLLMMNCVFDLIDCLLPERARYENLYHKTIKLLQELAGGDNNAYLRWEVILLQELGYALDLSCCSGCGRREDLKYLSPRTGRAVCADCGAPYIGRLYKLPIDPDVTMRFLISVCTQQGAHMPLSRCMLANKNA